MAAANKSTGLQIFLVFFVMLTIILMVVAFVEYRQTNELDGRLKGANDQRTKADAERQVANNNLDTMKGFLGYPNSTEVGKPEAEDNTVLGQMAKVIRDNAPGDLSKSTVSGTIQRLGQEVDNLQKEKQSLLAEAANLKQRIVSLQTEYQQAVDVNSNAKTKAEKDRTDAQNATEREVAVKEKEVADQQKRIQDLQQNLQVASNDLVKEKEQSKSRIANLEEINLKLRRQDEERRKTSFDVPSGLVEWVDRETGLVWINRGEADALRKGVDFSVYKQVNKGVARGLDDIKGSIEVTRVIGPHQSEARITKSKNSDPIISGDPIYTPLWKAGQKEQFAVVGLIDFDNDGVSDREVLHDLVTANNGVITDEVDDQGVRHPTQGAMNVGTKFLVVGKIPDYTESRQNEKEGHRKIGELHKKMREEAQEHGIRIVSLEDFLAYIGYEPGRRIWRPGVTKEWNLHQGMQGPNARPNTVARPTSVGRISGAYNTRGVKIQQSQGTTSKLFQQKSTSGQ